MVQIGILKFSNAYNFNINLVKEASRKRRKRYHENEFNQIRLIDLEFQTSRGIKLDDTYWSFIHLSWASLIFYRWLSKRERNLVRKC